MDFKTVERFIEMYDDDDFTGGISEDKILDIEKQLHVQLPESYKWFLRKYGSGGIFGIDILGHGLVNATVVETTNEYKKYYGLEEGIVVIIHVDAFAYCLDTNKMRNGECPVISWDVDSGSYDSEEASNFLEFFWNYLNEMKENWEEDEEDW
ncbi:SMI1/KNR4 family protein [Rummeliibacillus sp. TYF005]|uniref:SMI1/KNR4 family protein n=1 Tax=unclassified Rummeliibacillus TaxID=2622809 RepID=UPI000E664F15|nr:MULTISPECIES: SMI1/KNR4 family protein [unclassified Rummeliibacillus]RIJ66373.1 SMI1/KNR4 family protein [Rummeliibacillus sp. POC4]RPJ93915.1 SMI1/KNR4 family protein [Rummeliibacillus sp. TYF005]